MCSDEAHQRCLDAHHVSMIFDKAHFDIERSVFTQVPRRGTFFCSECSSEGKDAFIDSHHNLFVELWASGQIGGFVIEVINLEYFRSAFGVATNELRCLEFSKAFPA